MQFVIENNKLIASACHLDYSDFFLIYWGPNGNRKSGYGLSADGELNDLSMKMVNYIDISDGLRTLILMAISFGLDGIKFPLDGPVYDSVEAYYRLVDYSPL